MPRIQKVSEKVFADIAETPQKKGAYTTFLEVDNILYLKETDELVELKKMYYDLIIKSKDTISQLAALEEIIIQIRCKNVIHKEIRLSLSRNYIYARSIFFRRGNQINDIRTIVGTTEEWGDDLHALLTNKEFLSETIPKLTSTMDKEINKNINQLTLKIY